MKTLLTLSLALVCGLSVPAHAQDAEDRADGPRLQRDAPTRTTGPTVQDDAPRTSPPSSPAPVGATNTNLNETIVDGRTVYVPSVVPMTPPSHVGTSELLKETTACGPLQQVVRTPVTGIFFGAVKRQPIDLGTTDELAPYVDEAGQMQLFREVPVQSNPNAVRLIGHQATIVTTSISLASTRNVALGGASGSGSWAQAGAGASSAMTQLVSSIQLRSCDMGVVLRRR